MTWFLIALLAVAVIAFIIFRITRNMGDEEHEVDLDERLK